MKRGLFVGLLLLCALGVAPAAQAADSGVKDRVAAVLDAQCSAIVAGDAAAFAATLAPRYVFHMQGRSVSRDQIVAQAKMKPANVKFTRCVMRVDSVAQNDDDTVRAIVDEREEAIVKTRHGDEPLVSLSKSMLTLVPGRSSLRLARTDQISSSVWVAGRIVRQSGASPAPPAAPAPKI